MKLHSILKDEDAVSPVIGVILMVAITVILAAVIGAFVLELGGEVNNAPSASFSYDYEMSDTGADDSVEVVHDGGDALDDSTVTVIVAGAERSGSWSSLSDDSKVVAGSTYTFDESGTDVMESGDDIRVVWNDPESDQSSTISSSTVP